MNEPEAHPRFCDFLDEVVILFNQITQIVDRVYFNKTQQICKHLQYIGAQTSPATFFKPEVLILLGGYCAKIYLDSYINILQLNVVGAICIQHYFLRQSISIVCLLEEGSSLLFITVQSPFPPEFFHGRDKKRHAGQKNKRRGKLGDL
jgi:hypothetical protein